MIFRHVGKVMLSLILAALLSGCFGEEKQAIRIGINAWPGYEFLFLAREKGFFEKHDVKIELVGFTSLGDVRLAFERKQVDGMASTLIEVIETRGRTDQKAEVFLIADYSEGGDVIVGLKAGKSIADLKGKRIGSELASLNIFVLTRALEKAGLSITDIEIVPMDQSVMLEALKTEEVSAVVTYPPTLNDILALEQAHALFTSKEIPGEIVDVLSLNREILAERQDDVRHLI
ncbi:MAG: ABC transporter substrate-binding protein, partial [Sneathiella sp.]